MTLFDFFRQPRRNPLKPLGLMTILLGSTLLAQVGTLKTAQAQTGRYCVFTRQEAAQKEQLRQAGARGDRAAEQQYQTLIRQHGSSLVQCRQRGGGWPKTQAIWLRLYPCDVYPGVLEQVLDHIVNKGYNEVYIEVFYDSQVLLPVNNNPTPWISVVRTPGQENVDLLAQALEKGRARGLKMYAWLFSMNYGYAYGVDPSTSRNLARNGRNQTSIEVVPDGSQAFVDPYNPQARNDYARLVQAVLRRRPDGVLFDYIRYPRGSGGESVSTTVQDLWVYGAASRQALIDRASNQQGRALIERFLNRGRVTSADVSAARSQFPDESSPQWPGRGSGSYGAELWQLSVMHAAQGVIDFLNAAARPVMSQRLPAGAVFFPGGNKPVGQGYDSRLQPWDRFSQQMEWHAMSYSICGNGTHCIVDEVQRVLDQAGPRTRVVPALAGQWGEVYDDHPPLENQMQALQRNFPQLEAVSHFAYSWQEPRNDQARRACR